MNQNKLKGRESLYYIMKYFEMVMTERNLSKEEGKVLAVVMKEYIKLNKEVEKDEVSY